MANETHIHILRQGVSVWNKWRRDNPNVKPDLSQANFYRAFFSRIDLSSASLSSANLSEADLYGANLSHAYLDNSKLSSADLREADLSMSDLSHGDLSGTFLSSAKLYKSHLVWASFSGSKLNMADLREANLYSANLNRANLTGTDLCGANLTEANLFMANLTNTKFSRSYFGLTLLGNIDLSETLGLDEVNHTDPSVIGIDTIFKSKGKIPESFLRGAGVPNDFLNYMRSLVLKPVEFFTCFISYSSKDKEFAEKLYNDLQSQGVRCWFAPTHMRIGDKIRRRIDETIRVYDKLLLILSQHSLQSQWVEQEVETALEKERDVNVTVLFPVSLDNEVLKMKSGWAKYIMNTRHIGDFTNWKSHDEYQEAFARLVNDLRSEVTHINPE